MRTGTFLFFTAQIHMQAVQTTTPFATGDKLEQLHYEIGREGTRRARGYFGGEARQCG